MQSNKITHRGKIKYHNKKNNTKTISQIDKQYHNQIKLLIKLLIEETDITYKKNDITLAKGKTI